MKKFTLLTLYYAIKEGVGALAESVMRKLQILALCYLAGWLCAYIMGW